MAKVAEQYPDDLDAITLYADALFLLEPRRGTRDVNAPNIKRLHGVLESALKMIRSIPAPAISTCTPPSPPCGPTSP